MSDEYIKIAGQHPSESIKQDSKFSENAYELDKQKELGNIEKAVSVGKTIADKVLDSVDQLPSQKLSDSVNMRLKRAVLLMFTAIAMLEKEIPSSVCADTAKSSFLKEISVKSPEFYAYANDSGEFSFYFLAFRRKIEVERRIGQTFAMLCSHDGDPVYQELGEAIFCWFSSLVCREVDAVGFKN